MTVPMLHAEPLKDGSLPQNTQQHVFAVNGSGNHFYRRRVRTSLNPISKLRYPGRCSLLE